MKGILISFVGHYFLILFEFKSTRHLENCDRVNRKFCSHNFKTFEYVTSRNLEINEDIKINILFTEKNYNKLSENNMKTPITKSLIK
jgi:hypothetical protein